MTNITFDATVKKVKDRVHVPRGSDDQPVVGSACSPVDLSGRERVRRQCGRRSDNTASTAKSAPFKPFSYRPTVIVRATRRTRPSRLRRRVRTGSAGRKERLINRFGDDKRHAVSINYKLPPARPIRCGSVGAVNTRRSETIIDATHAYATCSNRIRFPGPRVRTDRVVRVETAELTQQHSS